MRTLVLGGTLFLSHAVAASAAARGHEVTCAARGVSGPVPEGAAFVPLDRDRPDWSRLAGRQWDVVVDVSRRPSQVRAAVDALVDAAASYVFVSTCSVYADHSVPGQGPEAPVLAPPGPDVADDDMEHYGGLKVACEQAVTERFGEAALVVRPGLIVGPGDPSGRFAYWPRRMAESSTVLAPGEPDDPVQVIDVRDLAAWLVGAAERQVRGTFDATGPRMRRADVLAAVAAGVGTEPRLVWVPQEFLLENGVAPWMGDRSLPLWLPLPEYAGLMDRDVTATVEAGLVVRPLEETARDTFDWLQQAPEAKVVGLSATEQRELLHRWHHVDLMLS
ncbi:MAG TPA: NAD-dependent epimerase/dehydratase family protein [Nocardioidaceae bacterium]|nr:NAD-dependent epimerase/dehydratase family protein [Nocardioidaceae bacterium]